MISKWIHRDFRLDGIEFSSTGELIAYIDERYPQGSGLIRSWLGPEGEIEVNTSGSTGKPKTIVLTREQMRQSALATARYFGLSQGCTALLCLPLKNIAGKMMLVRAMTLGWRLEVVEARVNLEISREALFDFGAMIPLQVAHNLESLEQFKNLIVGGAPIHKDLQRGLDRISTRVYATYGMTETATHIALRPVNQSAGRIDQREIFTGLPGVAFKRDERGCLVVHCPRISEREIITNDLVQLISGNQFIWLGRIDNVINSGSLKLMPEVIERKFSDCLTRRFFAVGLPDPKLGQKLAFVVEGPTDQDLMRRLREFQSESEGILQKHELPKELFFVPVFAETDSKKVDRNRTLELIK